MKNSGIGWSVSTGLGGQFTLVLGDHLDRIFHPATIFITGDSDTRVAPLHARKMNALLQNATGSHNPVLLLYDTKSGHSGGMPLSKQIEDKTNWMSFIMWQLGMINMNRN